MAGNLSAQLNETPGCIPSKWNRFTVADGDWLQAKTLKPLSSRDNWLAEQIEELSGNFSAVLDEEISARIAGDTYLSGAISSISSDFYPFSAKVETSAYTLNSAIYDTNIRIDKIEATTDVIAVFGTYEEFTAASASEWQQSVTDKDFIKVLKDDSVSSNQVYYEYHSSAYAGWEGWSAIGTLDPYYSVSEINSFSSTLSSTIANNYLSASTAAVSSGHNIVVTKDPNHPKITIATKNEVDFDGVSATNLSATNASGTSAIYDNLSSNKLYALTASGNSAKFDNILATNVSANNFRSEYGNVYAWTLDYISANGDNLTANNSTIINLKATNLNDTNVNSLIGSAQSGKYAYDVISGAKFSAVGTTTNTAYISGGFGIEAGNGVGVTLNGKNIVLSAAGTTYGAGNYISTASNTISVTNDLINSAKSGQSAYNWITSKSASLYPGSGINFYDAGNNRMGIAVKYTTTSGYVTALDNIPLSAGMIYGNGNYIEVNNSTKKINLSSNIVINYMSATSAQLSANYTGGSYYNYLTPSSTKFSHGLGSVIISLSGVEKSDNSTTAYIPWEKLTNNYVLTTGNASGSKLSASTAITFVVTSTLPSLITATNTYYIV